MSGQILNDYFDTPPIIRQRVGVVVGGSLSKGLDVKLDRGTSVEDLAVGRYVVVRGSTQRDFFCMITDIALDSTNPTIRSDPPELDNNPFFRAVYSGTAAFGMIHVAPMLAIEDNEPRPVKTIPEHFTAVEIATVDDVNAVFGQEDDTHFNIGAPLELEETQVNLNLQRLVERSIGVFGKSGTGKSFLTRVVLAGTIQRDKAVNLIFDMHNDYGWEVTDERGKRVKGLRQLFPSKVAIFTLDEESSIRRQAPRDFVVEIGYDEIEPEDLAMLKSTMDLSDSMIDVAYWLRKRLGRNWIAQFLEELDAGISYDADEEFSEYGDATSLLEDMKNSGMSQASALALARRLRRFERFGFLKKGGVSEDSVKRVMHYLTDERKSVVLEFGRYGNALEAYILVANYLTRRIHSSYISMVERSLGDKNMQPPQLLITIEEAHKFLDPLIARQTIFGTIARELRKYNVTLLVVDQRPSAIDEEVMSQIGTRVTALLDNDRDIAAVLMGISGAGGLREVLSRLETRQQAIIMGHAVPMPVVIKPRNYDEDFYAAMGFVTDKDRPRAARKARNDFGYDEDDNRRL